MGGPFGSLFGSARLRFVRARKHCVMDGVKGALEPKVQVNRKQCLLDGVGEAKLTMLACIELPAGQTQWTLQLLADRLVE